jgi:cytochrome b561
MPYNDASDQYGLIAKGLHWLIALLIIALVGIGWWMVGLSYYDPWYHDALNWHKSLGIIVLLIVTFKIIWSFIEKAPEPQASLSTFERIASSLMHSMLRLAMMIIPVTGYLVSTSEGAAIEVFNWFSFPVLLQINERARDIAIDIHYYFAYATLTLVVLHAVAALKHQFIDHKGTLKRMF